MKNNKLNIFLCGLVPLTFLACAAPAGRPRPEPAKGGVIEVKNVTEFLRRIGSDRTLVLAPGDYILPETVPDGNAHLSAEKVFDGAQIVLTDIKNLTIRASTGRAAGGPELDRPGAVRPRILARPRYANVLTFRNARNINIEGIVAGHLHEGNCVGGVLSFSGARDVNILGSELFGSGTEGLTLDDVRDLTFRRSIIRDCTYGILTMKNAHGITFSDSTFRGNREFDLINIAGSSRVAFDRIRISGNRTGLRSYSDYALFNLSDSSAVTLKNSRIRNNQAVYFQKHRGDALERVDCDLADNKFVRGIDLKLR